MAGSGPAPSPNSRRQNGNQAHTWTDLPAEGFAGDLPSWPLASQSDREVEVWSQIWRTPQAAAWVKLGWTFDIALYVRWMVSAADDVEADLTAALKAGNEARQWSDRLGLNPTAMLKNRWRIKADDLEQRRESKPKAKSARERLKVAAADGVETA